MTIYKILLFTADDVLAHAVSSCLVQSGFKVILSASGVGSTDLIQVEQPTAVILDIDLPDYNSMAIIRKMRNDITCNRLPVILIGSNMREEDALIGLEVGADLCLRETFHPMVFIARLRSLLRRYESTFSRC